MVRTIGKGNIKKIQEMVKELKKSNNFNTDIYDSVKANIPYSWSDIYESADAEIDRVIMDEIFKQ